MNDGEGQIESRENGETGRDYQSPQREAAFFFGLFLRGHPADRLRQDIDFPSELLAKWQRRNGAAGLAQEDIQKVFDYRKRVLAIFNFLVNAETGQMM